MKKRNILLALLIIFPLSIVPSCDLLDECGNCKLITDDGNGNVTEGTPLPVCGESLTEKENELPVTVGNTTTYWECY